MWKHRGSLIAAFAVLGTISGGCYQAHLLSPQPDPLVTFCHRTVNVMFWGLKSRDTQSTYCELQDRLTACERAGGADSLIRACKLAAQRPGESVCVQSNAIDQVRVRRNFGHVLATVLTLGIWSPVQLRWACSKVQEPDGVIGTPDPVRREVDAP
jgi:hypothetical protein